MKFRIFLLSLFVLLFCSGCNVEYNLNIDDKLNLNEVIEIEATTNDEMKKISDYNSLLPVDINIDDSFAFQNKNKNIEYYEISKKRNNSFINFKYSYDVDLFNDNVFARSCYQYVTVMNNHDNVDDRDELVLSTSKKFLCFDNFEDLDNVIIKIKTKREVFSNNADSVDGDTYIWNITEANKDDAAISMVMSSEIVANKLSFFEKNALFIIVLSVFIVGGIIYILMKKRSEKVNEI